MSKSPLHLIRAYLQSQNAHALIIPSNDPHFSEYAPDYWNVRAWASGFTGSAGTLVVTLDKAGLWTDSRYFIQAENQLKDTGIALQKVLDRSSPGIIDWISNTLSDGQKLLVLDELTSVAQFNSYSKKLAEHNIEIEAVPDMFGQLWSNRPALPLDKIFVHDLKFAGESRDSKINRIREAMQQNNCDLHLITTLDDIAWTLNLRCADVDCNPVFVSYLLISQERTYLFVKPEKLDAELLTELEKDNIHVLPYDELSPFLKQNHADTILLDLSAINYNTYKSLGEYEIVNEALPSVLYKACKTETEINNIRKAMIKDGVALTHAFYWLEQKLVHSPVSEYDFAMKIAECRSTQEYYFGESFFAIVGYRQNGAIVHYRPEEHKSALIENKGMLLVDSGGQYHDGTTDITRTVSFSAPSQDQKTAYTSVLKGMIQLSRAVFPKGTYGVQLDILARQHLWTNGLSFSHGTGHGVGFFNNVHEGPQGIGPACSGRAAVVMMEGMVTSNEPGYYLEGKYGIRIENLIYCLESENPDFLEFETLTLFPIDTELADISMLTLQEKEWINNYHEKVYSKLEAYLDSEHKNWLKDKCQRI